jgi:hypothetical protein
MGCKAHFAANSACYWQEMQRRRPPEAALAQAVRGYAEHPQLLNSNFGRIVVFSDTLADNIKNSLIPSGSSIFFKIKTTQV